MIRVQAVSRLGQLGCYRQDIAIHLLKPARCRPDPKSALSLAVSDGVVYSDNEVLDTEPAWMSYKYSTAHSDSDSVMHWLPMKLAEWILTVTVISWIRANLSDELWIPDRGRVDSSRTQLHSQSLITLCAVLTVIRARLVASNGNVTCSTEDPRRAANSLPSLQHR